MIIIDQQKALETLVSLTGIAMGFANIPQALKIYRTRSARDVSAITYIILLFGNLVLLAYGIVIDRIPVVVTGLAAVAGVGLVLSGIFRYEKKGVHHRGI